MSTVEPCERPPRGTAPTAARPPCCLPARAGEPRGFGGWPRHSEVHPRACGGAEIGDASVLHVEGSSPRVRGSLAASAHSHDQTHHGSSPRVRGSRDRPRARRVLGRFIPARAGEPAAVARTPSGPAVHPRACGGAARCARAVMEVTGSSPRVRGSLRPARPDRPPQRFIPARAGEPTPPASRRPGTAVHPRACGGAP